MPELTWSAELCWCRGFCGTAAPWRSTRLRVRSAMMIQVRRKKWHEDILLPIGGSERTSEHRSLTLQGCKDVVMAQNVKYLSRNLSQSRFRNRAQLFDGIIWFCLTEMFFFPAMLSCFASGYWCYDTLSLKCQCSCALDHQDYGKGSDDSNVLQGNCSLCGVIGK